MGTKFMLEPTDLKPSNRERARSLALDAILSKIKSDPQYHGRSFKIAQYDKRSSASGMATGLKGRYGEDATCDGFTFGVAKNDSEEEQDKDTFVLIATYEPEKIVEGNLEKSVAAYKEKEREAQARYKAAAEAKKTGSNSPASTTEPAPTTDATTDTPPGHSPPAPAPTTAEKPAASAASAKQPTAEKTAASNARKQAPAPAK